MNFALGILGKFLVLMILVWIFRLNMHTRKSIDEWASKNNFTVVRKRFIPWHYYGFCVFGMHPANFRVTIKDSDGQFGKYKVVGGGLFWLSDNLKIKKI